MGGRVTQKIMDHTKEKKEGAVRKFGSFWVRISLGIRMTYIGPLFFAGALIVVDLLTRWIVLDQKISILLLSQLFNIYTPVTVVSTVLITSIQQGICKCDVGLDPRKIVWLLLASSFGLMVFVVYLASSEDPFMNYFLTGITVGLIGMLFWGFDKEIENSPRNSPSA